METPGLVVHGEAAPFSTALRSLVNNPLYSDVRFVVGQERQEVFAHRCLLACRCNFFQRLLGSEPGPGVPSPVVLSTVPAEAFLAVLEFLYTNSAKLHRHSAQFISCLTHRLAWRATCTGTDRTVPAVCDEGAGCGAGLRGPADCRILWPGTAAGPLCSFHRGPQPGDPPDPWFPGAVGTRVAAPAAQRQALRGRGRAGPGSPELGARGRGGAGAACGRGGGPGGAGAETGLAGSGRAERPGRAEPAGAAHPGGTDRGGVEMPCSAERGCGPGRPVPPPEGYPAPGASSLSGPAL
ncbi:BTB/POZ domain-containing protein 19 isoform X1 [Eschrichtius robustus]|uniref:BTB/POZ domain-containing protein 19 isoform X1 n=1 Tax=Eschrichtius robustus TaxID=9764 RepID=UPI0035C18554